MTDLRTDGDQLLRAIRERPADDAPRLIYADWLDERPTAGCGDCLGCGRRRATVNPGCDDEYECDDGPCRTCHGTGRVSTGNAERAEFIRVQCELARPRQPSGLISEREWLAASAGYEALADDRREVALRRREGELWESFGGPYERSRRAFGLTGNWLTFLPWADPLSSLPGYAPSDGLAVVRRGFVAEVRLTTTAFLGGECERCGGTGWIAGDGTHYDPCKDCGGTDATLGGRRFTYAKPGSGRTPGLAARLFREHPITVVRLTDREPGEEDGHYYWFRTTHKMATQPADWWREYRHFLPAELGWPRARWSKERARTGEQWPTADDALAALSAALVRYGRKAAGLPELVTAGS